MRQREYEGKMVNLLSHSLKFCNDSETSQLNFINIYKSNTTTNVHFDMYWFMFKF